MRVQRSFAVLACAALLLVPAARSVSTIARQAAKPFAVAQLFLELNDTDGDLGLHAEIDADAWTSLEIEGPGERMLLELISKGPLRSQGLTQLAFESAEPGFDDLPPAEFLRRFPEGAYEIEAVRQGGGTFESIVQLSHVLAAAPVALVNGQQAAESCDESALPEVTSPVLVDWRSVSRSHPEIGRSGPLTISRYQFFLERGATKLGVDLPPTVTEFKIPSSLTSSRGVYKFEIIARTSSGNNTAMETCFRIR